MKLTHSRSHATEFIALTAVSPVHSKAALRPPCVDRPSDWDLDAGTPDAWQAAVQICGSCELLTRCAELAQALIQRGTGPRALVWAGVAYDDAGRVVQDLERYRNTSVDERRPIRIVHFGPRPVRTEPAQSAPRRHLVLGSRILRSTGKESA
ncbi:hypothetical protein [Nocardia sp. CDC160]|uniref:hypothetical protein n=1 Tax=Nocardia sp. CDC160 TaxID=3112166 RepID=UPI002DB7A444|nr:hypothetical protein [Nocardia sp. CDC160]MEC3920672.1 hypothetical protein [Nocardia sp. CDC160]